MTYSEVEMVETGSSVGIKEKPICLDSSPIYISAVSKKGKQSKCQ